MKPGAVPSLFSPTTPSGFEVNPFEVSSELDVQANLVIPDTHPKLQTVTFEEIKNFSSDLSASNKKFVFYETEDGFFLFIFNESVHFYSFGKKLPK